jgi:hypothetical protein
VTFRPVNRGPGGHQIVENTKSNSQTQTSEFRPSSVDNEHCRCVEDLDRENCGDGVLSGFLSRDGVRHSALSL